MKIKYIKIENFRGIHSFECDSLSNINVFAGVNGAGKSTVLDAIKILLSWFIARIRNAKSNGITIEDEDITSGEKYCFLRVVLDNNIEWQIYKQHSKYRGKPFEKTELSGFKAIANEIAENIGAFAEHHIGNEFPMFAGYGTNRLVEKTPEKVFKTNEQSPLDALEVAMKNSINFHKFFIWYRELEDEENASARYGELKINHQLQTVRNAIAKFYPEYSDFKVKRKKPVGFSINKNGQEYSFDSLSDGEKTYLVLVMDIARKLAMTHPSLPDPLQGDGVVLIDEVDLHLHPSWQREVIDKIKLLFPNCQFLLTTHSPHIVSSVNMYDGDALFAIAGGQVQRILTNLYGLESDAILSEAFNMQSVRNPDVQMHLDKVSECLSEGDFTSDVFNENITWLKERVSLSDAIFAKINLKVALLKKQQAQ